MYYRDRDYMITRKEMEFHGTGEVPSFIKKSNKFLITQKHFGLEFEGLILSEPNENESILLKNYNISIKVSL